MSAPMISVPDFPLPPRQEGEKERWCELANAATEPNPFYHPAILIPALDHLTNGSQVHLIEALGSDNMLIGLMPVLRKPRHGSYAVSNVSNWMHDQCFFGAPLLRQGHEEAAWTSILAQFDEVTWSGNFLHLEGLDLQGPVVAALRRCCANAGRGMKLIASYERALLQTGLDAQSYFNARVRPKKRKEMRRLLKRLEEKGIVTHRRLNDGPEVKNWAEDFLALERSGWKGDRGTALDSNERTRFFFRNAILNAAEEGMLDMLRIDVNGVPVAMLVNFRMGSGAFSYKISFDERLARFSPGVLIEIDNLHTTLANPDIEWMDSCAAPDHPMIDTLWAERRTIGQFRVELKGNGIQRLRRNMVYAATSLGEDVIRSLKARFR